MGWVQMPTARIRSHLATVLDGGALVDQMLQIVVVSDPQGQVQELKRLSTLLKPASTAPEQELTTSAIAPEVQKALASSLAELAVVPRPYNFHTQLKACIMQLCRSAPESEMLVKTALEERLQSMLLQQSSLLPSDSTPCGMLREASMPGWPELLPDLPIALDLLRGSALQLFELMARSLRDGLFALRTTAMSIPRMGAAAFPEQTCKTVQACGCTLAVHRSL